MDLKTKLVEQAIEEMNQGHADFSLRDLSKSLGVSHTAPYRHFKSKEEVLVEIAIVGFQKLEDYLMTAKVAKTNRDYFFQMGKQYLSFAAQFPNHYQLMFGNAIKQPNDYPRLKEAGKKCFAHLLEMVMGLQRSNFIIQENPLTLAFHIWTSIHGHSLFQVQNKIQDMKEAKDLDAYSSEPLDKWENELTDKLFEMTLKGMIAEET